MNLRVSCQGECGWAWSPISLRCWDSCQNIHEGTMGTLPDVHCCVAIESDSEGWTNFQHLFGRLTNAKKKEVFVNSRKTSFSKSSERGFLDPWVAEQLPLGGLIWTLWHCCGMGEYETLRQRNESVTLANFAGCVCRLGNVHSSLILFQQNYEKKWELFWGIQVLFKPLASLKLLPCLMTLKLTMSNPCAMTLKNMTDVYASKNQKDRSGFVLMILRRVSIFRNI